MKTDVFNIIFIILDTIELHKYKCKVNFLPLMDSNFPVLFIRECRRDRVLYEQPDSEAKKPEDWDETLPEYVEDLDAIRPNGWLESEPALIPDPTASKPTDWYSSLSLITCTFLHLGYSAECRI